MHKKPMVSYKWRGDNSSNYRFVQYADDELPCWADDIKPYSPNDETMGVINQSVNTGDTNE